MAVTVIRTSTTFLKMYVNLSLWSSISGVKPRTHTCQLFRNQAKEVIYVISAKLPWVTLLYLNFQ
jgi:hypothetical protein